MVEKLNPESDVPAIHAIHGPGAAIGMAAHASQNAS
jgi:hypothetical protein